MGHYCQSVSPAVAAKEQMWYAPHQLFMKSHRLHYFVSRYVDNRVTVLAEFDRMLCSIPTAYGSQFLQAACSIGRNSRSAVLGHGHPRSEPRNFLQFSVQKNGRSAIPKGPAHPLPSSPHSSPNGLLALGSLGQFMMLKAWDGDFSTPMSNIDMIWLLSETLRTRHLPRHATSACPCHKFLRHLQACGDMYCLSSVAHAECFAVFRLLAISYRVSFHELGADLSTPIYRNNPLAGMQ